jgi:ubiquinone/menaquinone biosynthesis C-methylase UbiE
MPKQTHHEHPSTYFVQDRSNDQEMQRLQIQDQFITAGMGGVLPEQPDPSRFRRVLDVGCGTGGWLIAMANTYPSIDLLMGVDISRTMVDYARRQAEASLVSNRMAFRTMDALRMLEFPNHSFDLVNQRAGVSYLRTWDWPKLLEEYQRVCRPGGVIRVTEFQIILESTSPALTQLCGLLAKALFQAGHLFTSGSHGITSQLDRVLRQYGLEQVQTRACTLDYRAGTSLWQGLCEDVRIGFQTILPFLRKWTRVPDDYETIYKQALAQMQQPDFVGTGGLLTAWGTVCS